MKKWLLHMQKIENVAFSFESKELNCSGIFILSILKQYCVCTTFAMHQACLGPQVLRLCEYIICNSRNVLIFKTIYSKINNQKQPKLQLFLLRALGGFHLARFC